MGTQITELNDISANKYLIKKDAEGEVVEGMESYICIRDHVSKFVKTSEMDVIEVVNSEGKAILVRNNFYYLENGDTLNIYLYIKSDSDDNDFGLVNNYLKPSNKDIKVMIVDRIKSLHTRDTNIHIHLMMIYNKEFISNDAEYALSKNRGFYPEFLEYNDRKDAFKLVILRKDIIAKSAIISPEMKFSAIIGTKYPGLNLPSFNLKEKHIIAGMTQYRKNLSKKELDNMKNFLLIKYNTSEEKAIQKILIEFSEKMAERGLIL